MLQLSKKHINFLVIVGATVVGLVLAYFFLTTVVQWLLPFILAYAIAHLTDPLVTFQEKKLRIPRKIASAITILSTLALIASMISFIGYRIFYELKGLAEQLPALIDMFSAQVEQLFNRGLNIYNIYLNMNLPIEASQFIDSVLGKLAENITSLLDPITTTTTRSAFSFAKSLPSIMIFTIVLVVSTYFMSSDRDKIRSFIHKQMPAHWLVKLVDIKDDLTFALLGYIKAQLILMSITFVEISIGLLFIQVRYAILLALLISFIDALPILGTGSILLPWALFSLITGNYRTALSLVILYAIVLLIRQLLEPKIVSGQIGLYPLVTLLSMYVGLKIFGILGMILGPVTVLVLRNLQKAGIIRVWND